MTTIKVVTVAAGIEFPHAVQALQITRKTRPATARSGQRGRWRTETIYAITDLGPHQARPHELAAWIRGHWQIENGLHWVRDVTFAEDLSTVRTGAAPQLDPAPGYPGELTAQPGLVALDREHPDDQRSGRMLAVLAQGTLDATGQWWVRQRGHAGKPEQCLPRTFRSRTGQSRAGFYHRPQPRNHRQFANKIKTAATKRAVSTSSTSVGGSRPASSGGQRGSVVPDQRSTSLLSMRRWSSSRPTVWYTMSSRDCGRV